MTSDHAVFRIVVRNTGDYARTSGVVTRRPRASRRRRVETRVGVPPSTSLRAKRARVLIDARASAAKYLHEHGHRQYAADSTTGVRDDQDEVPRTDLAKKAKRSDLKTACWRRSTTVSNVGDAEARTHTVVEDQIPAGMSFIRALLTVATQRATSAWRLGTINPASRARSAWMMSSRTSATTSNTATATAYCCKGLRFKSTGIATGVVVIPASR